MLPFSLSSNILIESSAYCPTHRVLYFIYQGLVKQKAKRISLSNNRFYFTGGWFRPVHSLNALYSISTGEIQVERHKKGWLVYYRVRFTQLVLFTSFAVFFFLGPIYLAASKSIAETLGILAFIWLFFVGVNIIIFLVRFPNFVENWVTNALNWLPQNVDA